MRLLGGQTRPAGTGPGSHVEIEFVDTDGRCEIDAGVLADVLCDVWEVFDPATGNRYLPQRLAERLADAIASAPPAPMECTNEAGTVTITRTGGAELTWEREGTMLSGAFKDGSPRTVALIIALQHPKRDKSETSPDSDESETSRDEQVGALIAALEAHNEHRPARGSDDHGGGGVGRP